MERQNKTAQKTADLQRSKPAQKRAPGREQREPVAGNEKSQDNSKDNITTVDQSRDRE